LKNFIQGIMVAFIGGFLLFLVTELLFPTCVPIKFGPPISTDIPTRSPALTLPLITNVTGLRFFESGNENLPLEQRVYAERFAKETTRYINWELNLEYPALGRGGDFQITAVYYFSNSANEWEEFHRHTIDAYVEGDWTSSYYSWGYGFDNPGNWTIGTYRVGLYVEGKEVAGEQFEIY
jgi:hypothetical protein